MLVAAGQFAVSPVWEKNAETCVMLMSQAAGNGASMLVLPEAFSLFTFLRVPVVR